jgi:hypothetical protein
MPVTVMAAHGGRKLESRKFYPARKYRHADFAVGSFVNAKTFASEQKGLLSMRRGRRHGKGFALTFNGISFAIFKISRENYEVPTPVLHLHRRGRPRLLLE